MIYLFLKLAAIFAFNTIYKVKVKGIENVPKEGKVILAPRHCSYFDPMVLFHVSPRRFHAVVAKSIYNIWWLKWVFRATYCVPTNGSVRGAMTKLKEDKVILIFPEGGCALENQLMKGHKGVAVFALRSGAPVIPIWIEGTLDAWSVKKKIPRIFCNIEVRFGPPLNFPKRTEEIIPSAIVEETLDKIMKAIAAVSD